MKLTPKRIAEIEKVVNANECPCRRCTMLAEVLTDREFWRDAVKNAGLFNQAVFCPFCNTERDCGTFKHKPDCAWLLAQEGEAV